MMSSVLAGPDALPGFWVFMYYLSPFTYLVDGMLSTGLANTQVICSIIELRNLEPTNGQTCQAYMAPYIDQRGGYFTNPNSTEKCEFCSVKYTNVFLKSLNSEYSHRWRNFAIMWGFIGFNIFAALFLYWLARVPKKQKVLDSPPTDQASRIPTKVSQPADVGIEGFLKV
jgi:ATP-binding cassette, subfamily G (WHITE), member 2, PDR